MLDVLKRYHLQLGRSLLEFDVLSLLYYC
uniref:Uncharacterized protein n=1 Tax=Arundo donax TaxID=35708 RepID=A0A0A9EAP9_ARUDO